MLTVLERECSRVSELLRSHQLKTPVGHLGRWKVREDACPAKKPGRIDIMQGATDESATAVSGSSDQLLLALWNRLRFSKTELVVTGEEAAAACLISL